MSKLLLFAAPSGAGKTTIVQHLLERYDQLAFSVSATTRNRRPHETEGQDYYFIDPERFQKLIQEEQFIEWEEVYDGLFYGTLRSELGRLWGEGKHIIFDIDVKGALNIKKTFPDEAVAVFVKPPSLSVLDKRLRQRGTESAADLAKRLRRAKAEMEYEPRFDKVLVNDELQRALREAETIVEQILKNED